jgi:hypothetical protein
MRFLRDSLEEEMVAEFLKGEIKSPRWQAKIKTIAHSLNIPIETINEPDLTIPEQNNQRAQLLKEFRGYRDKKGVFAIVPENIQWKLFELNKTDIINLYYINYSYWRKLSKGSLMVKVGVETIFEDEEILGQSNQQFYKVATEIERGIKLPPLILLKRINNKFTILEGNVRATAIGIARVSNFTVKAIIGEKSDKLLN